MSQALVIRVEQELLKLLELLGPLEPLELAVVLETCLVEVVDREAEPLPVFFGSVSLGGPGLGPPAASCPPPGGVGGCQSQQRPQELLLPTLFAQNSGMMQPVFSSQSGPVHAQAPVGLMVSEPA